MAEKVKLSSYDEIMKDMRARKFAPIYLLFGTEPYYIDLITDYIAENAIKPEERDFNQMVFYGLDTQPSQAMDAAHAAPMMAEYQVVIIREAQLMRGVENLEKYFRKPVPSTIFVVCCKKDIPRSKKGWIEEASKNGVIFVSNKLRDRDLPGFITTYLKNGRFDIEPKAVSMIADSIGPDLSRIASELDKLIVGISDKETRITPELVEEKIGISKDYNPYELTDAIIKKDVLKVNRIVKYFDKTQSDAGTHQLIPLLFRFFQDLMAVWYCPNKSRREDIAAFMGLSNPWQANNFIEGMKRYNALQTMRIIQKLRETAAKSNGLDRRTESYGEMMQELMYFILHV